LGPATVTETNRGDILIELKKNRKRSVDEITEDIRSQVNAQEPTVRAECVRALQDMIGDLTSETEPMQLNCLRRMGPLLSSGRPAQA
jgi:hypothetical protein